MSELPVSWTTTTSNAATTTASRADSTIATLTKEDNAPGCLEDSRLLKCKEIFSSLLTALHKLIEPHILKAIYRSEAILKKMQGIAKLVEADSHPYSRNVNMILSFTDKLKNSPENCKQLQDWDGKKAQFQKELKNIMREQSNSDLTHQIWPNVELIMEDSIEFCKPMDSLYNARTEPWRNLIRATLLETYTLDHTLGKHIM